MCGKEGIKAESEYKRNLKKGRKNYCCRECAAKGAGKTRLGVKRSASDTLVKHLRDISGNIQFVSTPINYMKSTMSDSQTKKFLKEISSYTSAFTED